MVQDYIVVIAPQGAGGWCAHFPDFPGCRAMGDLIEVAIENSSREVASWIDRAHKMPAQKSEEEVCANNAWADQRGIDWSTAVISWVPLSISGHS